MHTTKPWTSGSTSSSSDPRRRWPSRQPTSGKPSPSPTEPTEEPREQESSMGQFIFQITDPAPGAVKSRILTVSGFWRNSPEPPHLPAHQVAGVRVQFGPGGPVVDATKPPGGALGTWTATGTLRPS